MRMCTFQNFRVLCSVEYKIPERGLKNSQINCALFEKRTAN